MSILIKGASSLKEGLYQIQDGKIHAYKGKGGKTGGYDLIEVPTPHGRLIDADAILSRYTGNILTAQLDYAEGLRDAAEDMKAAPTIIEAEEDSHE